MAEPSLHVIQEVLESVPLVGPIKLLVHPEFNGHQILRGWNDLRLSFV